MAEKNQRSKEQPKLKVVGDTEKIHRLGASPKEAAPARKKALLHRSYENAAISRDLIGKEVADLPGQELPTDAEDDGSASSQPTPPLRIPPAFFVIVAFGFFLLLGLGIFLALGGRNRDDRHKMQDRSRENILSAQQEKEDAREIVGILTTALQNYTSARTVEEKLAFARQQDRVEPLMREYYQEHELVSREGAKLISQYALPIESRSFVILTASFPEGPHHIFLAEVDNDLNVLIDWESDACYQPVEVTDYIAKKSTEPVTLRVFAKPDHFYVYEYTDSSKYQCLKLTFRDNDEHLFGYVRRDTPASKRLERHFQLARQQGRANPEPLLLTIKFQKNSQSERGVLIEEFLAPRWANIDEYQDNE